jgi:hypothetical protein
VVNFPSKDKLPEIFGGASCPDIKLSQQELSRLGTSDPCEAAAKLLDGFKLSVAINQCDDGVTGTNKTFSGKLSETKITEKVVKGCKYDVLLEVGELETNKVYFSNADSYRANLDVPKTAPATVSLKLELNVTDLGIAIGFPKTEKIITTTEADLSIDVTFGKGSPSPAPSDSNVTIIKSLNLQAMALKKSGSAQAPSNLLDQTLFPGDEKVIVLNSAADAEKYSANPAGVAADFTKQMVVGYAFNAPTGGYAISIDSIKRSAGRIVVRVTITPPQQAATQAFEPVGIFALIEKSALIPVLEVTKPGSASSSPNPAPTQLSFQQVSEQVLAKKCAPCHDINGPSARQKFVNNETLFKSLKTQILSRISASGTPTSMPPAAAPQLVDSERQIIQKFLN